VSRELALTYPHWMETLDILIEHEATTYNEKQLAAIAKALFEIHKYDPETIAYMNGKAEVYMNQSEES
jgi:hypothetical protein